MKRMEAMARHHVLKKLGDAQAPEADLDRALSAEMWLSGFRAAREMAAAAIDQINPCSPDSIEAEYAALIRALGEESAE